VLGPTPPFLNISGSWQVGEFSVKALVFQIYCY